MQAKQQTIGNGSMKLPLILGKHHEVWGGPFVEVPETMVGVKMAAEIKHPFHISIPTRDFSVPDVDLLNDGLEQAVKRILKGDPVYVGCMAGRGRTGLFLAILAKAFGIKNPVEYVRKNYFSHAVETPRQYQFVTEYVVPDSIVWDIKAARWWALFRFRQNLTNTPKSS